MISGSGDYSIEEKARRIGARDYVAKPLMQRDLLKVIDHVLVD